MKKLSIEEKAKRYDEILAKAKRYYDEYKTRDNILYVEDMEDMFPELKESEDDRIRKWIIGILSTYEHDRDFRNAAIDWLEKQGKPIDKIVKRAMNEKQRVLLTETDGSANIDWDCRSLDDVKILLKCGLEFIRTIEANKQMPTESRFSGCSFRVPTRYDKGVKQGGQKPAEWSEEDERNLNDAILFIETGTYSLNKDNLINWLKSLRPQSQWKPSDEQMNALNYVVNLMASSERPTENDLYYNILKSLREQLRKLKE